VNIIEGGTAQCGGVVQRRATSIGLSLLYIVVKRAWNAGGGAANECQPARPSAIESSIMLTRESCEGVVIERSAGGNPHRDRVHRGGRRVWGLIWFVFFHTQRPIAV